MSNRSGRVVIVGFDGATFDLILPWVREGKLPTFKKMLEQGVHGPLDPPPNMRSAASWTSFYTGKNPGKHGIYEFYDFIPGTYNIHFINGSFCFEPSVWRIISEHGLIPIVINVPMTYPAEPTNGVILAGLDAPGTGSKGFCHPSNILKELEDQVGAYILEPGLTGFIIDDRLDMAVERLFEEIEQKRKVMFHLMKNKSWDFFTIVYRSLDAAQHCFWKFMDPNHPHHDPHLQHKYGDVILKVYQKLDAILGEIQDYLHPDDTLLVMSDHGFGPKHPANNQLNAWLASKGYLTYRKNHASDKIRSVLTRMMKEAYELLGAKLPRRHKEVLARIFPAVRNRVQSRLCFTGIDWSRSRAYSDTLFANIRINLKGRESEGIVRPGAEYETVVEEIRRELLGCRDVKTGKRLVEAVFHKDEIYWGHCREKAPDLTIRWREDIVISGIEIDRTFATNVLPTIRPFIPGEDASVISGDHRRFGILISCGSGIQKGRHIEGARIVDLAPTTLYLMDLNIPEDMDGKVLTSMFDNEHFSQKPAQTGKVPLKKGRMEVAPYDEEEREEVAVLRQLGYLE